MTAPQRKELTALAGGKTLAELSATLLRAIDPDAIAEQAAGTPGASPADVAPDAFKAARQQLITAACAPFDTPALRDALAKAKQEAEQTIDTVTIDTVTSQGFDAAAKEKAANLLKSFRDYIEQHRAEIICGGSGCPQSLPRVRQSYLVAFLPAKCGVLPIVSNRVMCSTPGFDLI